MLKCSHCGAPVQPEALGLEKFTPCVQCAVPLAATVFPALQRASALAEAVPAAPAIGDEAGCYYHPQKRAVVMCAGCGRFLCSLCDLELHGEHLCPSCLSTGRKKGRIRDLQNERVLYGNIALALAVLPIITVWLTIFTAPAALFVAFRYWKAPQSLLPSRRWKLALAALLAVLQIAGWIILVAYLFSR